MNLRISEKLHAIAKSLNELKDTGAVKGRKGNEHGYAKILQIKTGCSIWIHHWHDDRLAIDLLISQPALSRYPSECESSINTFKELFTDMVETKPWSHHDGRSKEHETYYIDVSKKTEGEILKLIDLIKSKYS
jgi:hypothetical protein